MSCVRVTPRPSYYAKLAELPPEPEPILTGRVTICFEVDGPTDYYRTRRQAAIRDVVAMSLGQRGEYHRSYVNGDDVGYYTWDGVTLHQTQLAIGPMVTEDLPRYEPLFTALNAAGWRPEDEITITVFPENKSMPLLFNLMTILESRRPLIEQALGLREDLKVIINDGLALGVMLGAFSYPKVEALACLMARVCQMAEATKKARMKPCDMSNPRYQMRSWLLRLGFIGEQYERPRRTLMEALDGDSAFFTDEQKQKAMEKRRRSA